jgi:hypothetical protein
MPDSARRSPRSGIGNILLYDDKKRVIIYILSIYGFRGEVDARGIELQQVQTSLAAMIARCDSQGKKCEVLKRYDCLQHPKSYQFIGW